MFSYIQSSERVVRWQLISSKITAMAPPHQSLYIVHGPSFPHHLSHSSRGPIVHHGVEKGRTGPNWNSLARHFAPLGTVKGNFNIRHGLIPAPTAGATQPNVRISNTPILPRKRVGRNSERVRNSEHSRVAVGGGRRRPGPEGPQADVYTSGVRSRSSLKPVISPPAGQREPFGPLPAVVYLIHPAR